MPTCPAGHDSASTDFCDVCGMRIDGPVRLHDGDRIGVGAWTMLTIQTD